MGFHGDSFSVPWQPGQSKDGHLRQAAISMEYEQQAVSFMRQPFLMMAGVGFCWDSDTADSHWLLRVTLLILLIPTGCDWCRYCLAFCCVFFSREHCCSSPNPCYGDDASPGLFPGGWARCASSTSIRTSHGRRAPHTTISLPLMTTSTAGRGTAWAIRMRRSTFGWEVLYCFLCVILEWKIILEYVKIDWPFGTLYVLY